MSYIKFLNSDEHLQGSVKKIDENTIEVRNCKQNLSGFQLFTDADFMFGDYSRYRYDYEEPNLEENVYRYTNDNHKWTKPKKIVTFSSNVDGGIIGEQTQKVYNYEELEVPTVQEVENYKFNDWVPSIPKSGLVTNDESYVAKFVYIKPSEPLESVKERKISEMNSVQQSMIANGFDIVIDGKLKHFTLTDHDQTSMLGLMGQVQMGIEQIPWHTSDHDEHCEYFTNEQMKSIIEKATGFLTYHITYFRDLRIYINNLSSKEEIEAVEYGIQIPNEYKSDVLKDLESKM
jgi:hypothetical protein